MIRDYATSMGLDILTTENEFNFNSLPDEIHPILDDELLKRIMKLLDTDNLSMYGLRTPRVVLPKEREVYLEETRYNYNELQRTLSELTSTLNSDQQLIYELVMQHVEARIPLLLLIKAQSGRGKTYLLNTIITALRSKKLIVLPCASTAVASLQLDNATTAHTLFKIPVQNDIPQDLRCSVTIDSRRGVLLKAATAFIWDECACIHRYCIESVSRLLKELTSSNAEFGGKIFILCGDFRQTAPIVPGGDTLDILNASFRASELYSLFTVHSLTKPMRDANDKPYSALVDAIGNGTSLLGEILPDRHKLKLQSPLWNNTFSDFETATSWLFSSNDEAEVSFSDITTPNSNYFLTALNANVKSFNDYIVDRFQPDATIFFSSNSLKDQTNGVEFEIF